MPKMKGKRIVNNKYINVKLVLEWRKVVILFITLSWEERQYSNNKVKYHILQFVYFIMKKINMYFLFVNYFVNYGWNEGKFFC